MLLWQMGEENYGQDQKDGSETKNSSKEGQIMQAEKNKREYTMQSTSGMHL